MHCDLWRGRMIRWATSFEAVAARSNRDERRFPDADRFDITRNGNRHIAFGRGIHHCVGAPLARMEAEIAFDRLLSRFGDIRLASDEPLSYRPSTCLLYTSPSPRDRS